MIKRLALLILGSSFYQASAQPDTSSFQQLLKFVNGVYANQLQVYGSNFFNGLLVATRHQLHPNNPAFVRMVKERQALTGKDYMEAAIKVADSIYTTIRNTTLWTGQEEDLKKFGPVLELVNGKYCPCISDPSVILGDANSVTQLHARCDSMLSTDRAFILAVQLELKGIPKTEINKIQPLASRYQYQHCPAFQRQINHALFDQVKENMENWSFMFKREFPVMIAGMYQRKSLDSLKKIFPGFEKSKKEIEQAVNMEQKYENMIRTEKQDEQFVFIVRTIYFTKGEKKKIIGEIETTIDSKDFMAPVVTAYRFTEGKHLKNYKELLKEIEEEMQKPPPPPMEVLIKQ